MRAQPTLHALSGAINAGLGELKPSTKTALVALGTLGVIGVVLACGMKRGRRLLRGTRGGIFVDRVRLNQGGYDSGGRYWGSGEPLYYVYDETTSALDRPREGHVRAKNAAEARRKFGAAKGLGGARRRRAGRRRRRQ